MLPKRGAYFWKGRDVKTPSDAVEPTASGGSLFTSYHFSRFETWGCFSTKVTFTLPLPCQVISITAIRILLISLSVNRKFISSWKNLFYLDWKDSGIVSRDMNSRGPFGQDCVYFKFKIEYGVQMMVGRALAWHVLTRVQSSASCMVPQALLGVISENRARTKPRARLGVTPNQTKESL